MALLCREVSDGEAIRVGLMKSLAKYTNIAPPRPQVWRTRVRLYQNPVIWRGVGVAMLLTSTYCGAGYLHYKRAALYEQIAAQRAERANIELQDTLDRLRNKGQRDIQQLKAERDHLIARVTEVEQKAIAARTGASASANCQGRNDPTSFAGSRTSGSDYDGTCCRSASPGTASRASACGSSSRADGI